MNASTAGDTGRPELVSHDTTKQIHLALREAEFDCRPRYVPCDILAADEVMRLAMVDRVSLQQAAVRKDQPFVCVDPVVGLDAPHAAFKAGEQRDKALQCLGRILPQCERYVARGHVEQFPE